MIFITYMCMMLCVYTIDAILLTIYTILHAQYMRLNSIYLYIHTLM